MNPRRTTLTLLALVLLAWLAWLNWPVENTAPKTNPTANKTAATTSAQSTATSALEAPKIAPVPANGPKGPDPADMTPKDYDADVQAYMEAKRAKMNLEMMSAPVFDLGDVHLSDGVPYETKLKDGSPVTITLTRTPSGDTYFYKIIIDKLMANGRTNRIELGTGGPFGPVDIGAAGGPSGALRLKFNPHLD